MNAAVLGAVLAVTVWLLLQAFDGQATNNATRSLVSEVTSFQTVAAQRPAGLSLEQFTAQYLRTHVLSAETHIVVAFPDGSVLASAGSQPLLQDPIVRGWTQRPPQAGEQRSLGSAEDSEVRAIATPIYAHNKLAGTLIVTGDFAAARADMDRVRTLALGEAGLALLVGTGAAYLLLRRLLRRIGRITVTAAEIGAGELDRRLGDQGTDDEVGLLAQTFDAMAARLSAAMAAQRRLLSDVSHQLRTPLTVARGHLEVLGRTEAADPAAVHETVDLVVDELDHMSGLVERLLMLGRALEPDFIDRGPVDLRSFCADLLEAARVLGARDWRLAPVPDVVADIDEPKLRGAMLNLVDNAVHATRDHDVIAISAAVDGEDLLLCVEDSGPGIPAAARRQALERFHRAGAADTRGTGLGLAIVTAVAEAHDGTVELTDSPFGGLRAELRLPGAVRRHGTHE